MSDEFFDADRAAGLYPPKGWGFKSREKRARKLSAYWALGLWQPWMEFEALRLNIKPPKRFLEDESKR